MTVRNRYGFEPLFNPGAADRCGAPAWSQRILLARRLVEAGVRLVTVDLRWWDTHVLGFDSLRRGFCRFDRAYSALIEDLEQRGLLESTLVIAWGESGARCASMLRRAATIIRMSSAPLWRVGRCAVVAWWANLIPRALFRRPIPRSRRMCWRRCISIWAWTCARPMRTTPVGRTRFCRKGRRSRS